jgi:hypothetical protein
MEVIRRSYQLSRLDRCPLIHCSEVIGRLSREAKSRGKVINLREEVKP